MTDAAPPDSAASLVGKTLGGKYRVTRLLGQGGMGEVYEATNTNTGRRVAIKTLHAHLLGHASLRQRFLQEARAATQIEHPNVIDVLDLDLDAALGVPFIVQEFLTGETLAERLAASPAHTLAPAEALRIAAPVMGALVAAHALGIVHRDLKPENVFLVRDRAGAEVPKVIDFGIAKVVAGAESASGTQLGTMLGTPAYMSPEQAMGRTELIDARTDVWAAGVVLYEMLSGRLPYEAENAQQTLGMIQYREPVPLAARAPGLPADLVAVIDRALTRDRDRRFPTMQAFLDALLATSVWGGVSAPPAATLVGRPSVPVFPAAPAQTLEAAVVTPPPAPASWQAQQAPAPRRPIVGFVLLGVLFVAVASTVSVVASRPAPRSASVPRARVLPAVVAPPPAAPPARAVAAPPPPLPPAPVAAPQAPNTAAVADTLTAPAPPRTRSIPAVRAAPPRPTPRIPTAAARPPRRPPGAGLDPDRDWQP